jgi:alpha,alpha-trehalase
MQKNWKSYLERRNGEKPSFLEFCEDGLKGLVRSLLDRLEDPKLEQDHWPIYYALKETDPQARAAERQAIEDDIGRAFERSKQEDPEAHRDHRDKDWREVIVLRELPAGFIDDPQMIRGMRTHGLLYQPHPYPVPGDFFNEFYPWDTKFGMNAMMEVDSPDLAKLSRGVVDNLAYQVEHYGTILNGTRSYYLTRSQPPFFTDKALQVYKKAKESGNWEQFDPEGKHASPEAWLTSLIPAMEKFYAFWTSEPHLHEGTGLSRYKARGTGPCPEVLVNEKGHYDKARGYFAGLFKQAQKRDGTGEELTAPPADQRLFAEERRMLRLFYDHDNAARYGLKEKDPYDAMLDSLKPLYYQGDESMRESGTDPTGRYGYAGVDVIHTLPVCLNSLLYKMEKEMAEIMQITGRGQDAAAWNEAAALRKKAMDTYLWDEPKGVYMDYNFEIAEEKRKGNPDYALLSEKREYPFASGLWPLWVGMLEQEGTDKERAGRMVDYHLKHLGSPHGILTSDTATGCQWDYPMIWPPLQVSSIEALRRYGFKEEALHIATGMLQMMESVYARTGKVFEKYNGRDGDERTERYVNQGYAANASSEEGFFLWGCSTGIMCAKHKRELEQELGLTPVQKPSRPATGSGDNTGYSFV